MSTYYAARFKDKIQLMKRTWDGIDRPEYEEIARMNPDDARYLAQQLFKAAEEIDGKSKKDRTAAIIERSTRKIAQEAKREAME